MEYSFANTDLEQTEVTLVHQFDSWVVGSKAIENRMPYLGTGDRLLTTADMVNNTLWGTLIASSVGSGVAPLIHDRTPNEVYYFMREPRRGK